MVAFDTNPTIAKIIFEPALNTRTVIRPCLGSETTALVTFRAYLEASEAARLRHEGVILQLWSNISSKTRFSGEWEASSFRDASSAILEATSPDTFDLPDSPTSSETSLNSNTMQWKITLPVPISEAQYRYTFRLLYPNGRSYWFGDRVSDGTIAVDPSPAWKPNTAGLSALGRLSDDITWSGWCVTSDNKIEKIALPSSIQPSKAIILLEEPSGTKFTPTKSLFFSSTGEPISVEGYKLTCQTPSRVQVRSNVEVDSLSETLLQLGLNIVETSSRDCVCLAVDNKDSMKLYILSIGSSVTPFVEIKAKKP